MFKLLFDLLLIVLNFMKDFILLGYMKLPKVYLDFT